MSLLEWIMIFTALIWTANFILGYRILKANKRVLDNNRGTTYEASQSYMDLMIKLEDIRRYLEEDDRVLDHQGEVIRAELDNLTDNITELRMEIAVLRGMNGSSIPLPYKGAKRGPKPRQVIEQEN